MMRRRGGAGIVGTMARTAVIAGTATAVSNKVTQRQMGKAGATAAGPDGGPGRDDRINKRSRRWRPRCKRCKRSKRRPR